MTQTLKVSKKDKNFLKKSIFYYSNYFSEHIKRAIIMTATLELNSARRKLHIALGEEHTSEYFSHMKAW